jgi:hypothetical protein
LAAYYKEAFENPEAFFIGVKTPDGDIPADAICVQDKDL